MIVPDPVSTALGSLVAGLDRGVERISNRAFDAAVSNHSDSAEQLELTPQQHLLQAVKEGRADSAAEEEIQEAIESGLLARGAGNELILTPLGEYLVPESEQLEAEETVVETVPAAEAS
jgi:hypothetical protein